MSCGVIYFISNRLPKTNLIYQCDIKKIADEFVTACRTNYTRALMMLEFFKHRCKEQGRLKKICEEVAMLRFFPIPICAVLLGMLLLGGCGSSGNASSGVFVGQKLYMSDGTEYGTVVAVEDAHQFTDGTVEPGVLVDYGPRIPGEKNWLPTRSAQTMAR